MNSTWLITTELANQRARKVLFTCVVYTNIEYNEVDNRFERLDFADLVRDVYLL